MGSCYSTKATQMPQTGDKKLNQSPTVPGQSKLLRPSSQKGRGGSFGFNQQNVGKRPLSKSENTVDQSNNDSTKNYPNDALKTVQDNTSTVQNSPKSRFGFKKLSIRSTKSVEKCSSSLKSTESLNSNKSDLSKSSFKSRELKAPSSVGSQRKLIYSGKAGLYQENKHLKMIDDSESSQSDLLSSDTINIKSSSDSHTCPVPGNAPKDDNFNANIPDNQAAQTDLLCKNKQSNVEYSNQLRNRDLNGNQNEVNSTTTARSVNENSPKSHTQGKTIVSRLPSKFKRQFVKSKTFHGQPNDSLDKQCEVKIKQSNSKDSGLSKPNNISASKQSNTRTSFLRRGFFSKQRSVSNSSEKSSQDKSNDLIAGSNSAQDKVVDKPVVSSKLQLPTELDQTDKPEVSETLVKEKEGFESENSHNVSNNLLENHSVTVELEEKDICAKLDETENNQSSIPLNLKEKLEKAHIPKGVAPIAILDSAETTSIGSINSDDLMLDVDLDLGPYDDEDDDITQSHSSFSHDKSLVMRNRSRSGSGRVRSRSKSHDKVPLKETKSYQSNEVFDSGIDSSTSSGKPKEGYISQNRTNISASGMEKRDHWYRKRYNSQSKADEENESVDELHSLIDLQKPVQRRLAAVDKPTRPVSFPGGIQKQVSDPSPHGMHSSPLNQMLRPPRIPSVTDDDKISVDGHTYRHMAQDITALKTMLFKLKRVIQDDELGSPMGTPTWKNGLSFGSSQPGSPFAKFADRTFTDRAFGLTDLSKDKEQQTNLENVLKENEDLKNQVHMLKQQVEEQEKTIKLLQQQMTKYDQIGSSTSHRDKPKNGSTTSNVYGNKPMAKKSLQYNNNSTSLQNHKREKATTNSGKKYGINATSGRSRPVTSTIIPDSNEFSEKENNQLDQSSTKGESTIITEIDEQTTATVPESLNLSDYSSNKNEVDLHVKNAKCNIDNKNIGYSNSVKNNNVNHEIESSVYDTGVKTSLNSVVKSRKDMYRCTNSTFKNSTKLDETIAQVISEKILDNVINSNVKVVSVDVHETENVDPNMINESKSKSSTSTKLVNSNSEDHIGKPKSGISTKKVGTGLPQPSGLPRFGKSQVAQKGPKKPQQNSKLPSIGNVTKVARPQIQLKSFTKSAAK